jgi:hypothetical protein
MFYTSPGQRQEEKASRITMVMLEQRKQAKWKMAFGEKGRSVMYIFLQENIQPKNKRKGHESQIPNIHVIIN